MNVIAVPEIPAAVIFMLYSPAPVLRAIPLLKVLVKCSKQHQDCFSCEWLGECRDYFDYLIMTDKIAWKGAVRHATRYYE